MFKNKKLPVMLFLLLSLILLVIVIKFHIFRGKEVIEMVDEGSIKSLDSSTRENLGQEDKKADKSKSGQGPKENKSAAKDKKLYANTIPYVSPIEGQDISPVFMGKSGIEGHSKKPIREAEEDHKKEKPKADRVDIKPVNLFFIIKDKVLISLTKEGCEEIEKHGAIRIPEGVVAIGEGAFKGKKLKSVEFPSTLKLIKRYAFYDNDLKDINLPTGLELIERGAFDKNNLEKLILTNPKCSIDGIFYNGKYVNIITANREIGDQTWKDTDIAYQREELKEEKAYGSLVNRAEVEVTYYDENENMEFEYRLVSKDRRNRFERKSDDVDKYFKIGEEINVVALKNDYLHLANVRVKGKTDSKVDFHYRDRAKEEEFVLDYSKPQINGTRQPILISINDSQVDLKKDIFATDSNMNDISSDVEVLNADEIKLGREGEYRIRYRVKDSEGNVSEAERKLYIEDPKKWYGHDFYYDHDVLVGLSRIGELKFNELLVAKEDKVIVLPEYSDKGNKLTKIGSAAFASLRVREVKIPEGYEIIRKMAFDSSLLEKLSLADTIKEIEDRAFSFTNIDSLKLPKNLEKIGKRAFSGIKIKELILSQKIKIIEEGAFINNINIIEGKLEIPSSVKFIGVSAFENCRIDKLILNEGLEEIGDAAFAKNNLTELTLPDSLKILAPGAFKQNGLRGAAKFHAVKLFTKDGKNPNNFASNVFQVINPKDDEEFKGPFNEEDFIIDDGGLKLSDRGKKKIKLNKELIIPDRIGDLKVEKIAELSFMSKNLTKLVLPDGLKEIGESAFIYNSLEELSLPDGIREIKNGTFFENEKLQSLKLPENIEKIEKNAFMNSSLSRVELPDTIKVIENNAFKKKAGKVTLVINYSEKTKEFIDANKKRSDFILEVLGQETTSFSISLNNKVTPYGIKSGDLVEFSIEGLNEKPKLSINGSEVTYTYMDNKAMISPVKYKDLLDGDGVLDFVFEYKGERVSSKLRFFEPDIMSLAEADRRYTKEERLVLELANSKYPYEGFSAYENKYTSQAMKNVTISGNTVTIRLSGKPKESSMTLYFTSDYHTKEEIKINFLEDEDLGLVFTTVGQDGDTVEYRSSAIDEETYEKLKEAFEDDSIEISAGRTRYSKGFGGSMLEDSEYYIEFNDGDKTINLYINKPIEWENLEINFSDISWNYYFDGKDIAKE